MKYSVLAAMAAATAIATPACAQYYDTGPGFTPPNQVDNRQIAPTWAGQTRYGNTVYFDVSDGTRGVLWQPRVGGTWFYKTDGGENGYVPADGVAQTGYQQQYGEYAPRYAPRPVYAPPAPVYRAPQINQYQAAYMFGRYMRAMFGY